jgi:heme exporter protein C
VSWISALAGVLVAATYVRVFAFTPAEIHEGLAQKIFYLHLPAALMAYVAFGVVAIASVAYLWLRDDRLDRIAESSAEVGVVFLSVVLTTGPFWGRPVWGHWWDWSEMRLDLTLFLWFIFMAYVLLRGAIDDRDQRARYSAVLAVLGVLDIPFIHLSVYMFRNIHPMPIVLKPSAPSLPGAMLVTLLISFVSFAVVYVALVRARYALATDRAQREAR